MAYSRYVTELKDKQNNIYGVMDEEARDLKADAINVLLSTPAPVMSFHDGADNLPMSLKVAVEPVQDLHGYDNPWPANGGKNKSVINTATLVKGTTDSVTAEFDTPLPAGTYIVTREFSGTATVVRYTLLNENDTDIANANIATNATSTLTISSPAYSINIYIGSSQAAGVTANITKIMLRDSSVSDDTFAPYSNICPITGWTWAKVTRTGKNLFDTAEKTEGQYISDTGNIVTNEPNMMTSGYMKVKEGQQYTFSGISGRQETSVRRIHAYDADKQWKQQIDYIYSNIPVGTSFSKTVTIPTGCEYVRFGTAKADTNIQFEKGSAASSYESFVANDTHSITFPVSAGTVYGGELTINKDGSGTLVVDRQYVTYTGSNGENWLSNGANGFYIAKYVQSEGEKIAGEILCSELKALLKGSSDELNVWQCRLNNAKTNFMVKPDATLYPDVASWKTYLASNNLHVLFERPTPLTYTLTPGQVKTLLGVNNVWADTGDINEVQYPADTKEYVDRKVSASQSLMELIVTAKREDSMVATRAYSSGDLLIVNGTLYKASTSIANGATLTVGTNVTATTVAAELAALA